MDFISIRHGTTRPANCGMAGFGSGVTAAGAVFNQLS
jgi:hypothetical protein